MSSSDHAAGSRPEGTVLSLGVSPWQRAAQHTENAGGPSTATGDAPSIYAPTGIPAMSALPESVTGLDSVPIAPAGVNMTGVSTRAGGAVGPVTTVAVPGVGGVGVVPVSVAGPAPGLGAGSLLADIVPTSEALEREKDSRQTKRQRLMRAEDSVMAEDRKLALLSKRLLFLGLCGLPCVHFVQVWYFSQEMLDKNSNWFVRRNAFLALFCGCVELFLAVAWFVIFQVMSDRFRALNILNSGFSLANLT